MLQSQIIGCVDFDANALAPELRKISAYPEFGGYTECIGVWKNFALGRVVRAAQNNFSLTELGAQLPYIFSVLAKAFYLDHLVMLHAFLMSDAIVMPHRDFLELEAPFVRLQLPLVTNELCLHSEEKNVFHMRQGEIWFFAASIIHGVCCLSNINRINLCLDFEHSGDPRSLIRGDSLTSETSPMLISLKHFSTTFRTEMIEGLSKVIDRNNFKDVMKIIAKHAYSYEIDGEDIWDIFIEVCNRSNLGDIYLLAREFKDHMLVDRRCGETFSWEKGREFRTTRPAL